MSGGRRRGRAQRHEDHLNHEAWAIPYGDLLTLLLAFFVVMYSISSVNTGKYRVLSEALSDAFGGEPRTMQPVQIGDNVPSSLRPFQGKTSRGLGDTGMATIGLDLEQPQAPDDSATGDEPPNSLALMGDELERALGSEIMRDMVVITRGPNSLEVALQTDILFTSGSAELSDAARPILSKVAAVLSRHPNMLRIEGHTDDRPIHTTIYPSNWELSAARAASVVHLFMDSGVEPAHMSVAGFGEFRPVADNATTTGRNQNRRVVIVVAPTGKGHPVLREAPLPPATLARPDLAQSTAHAAP